MDKWVIKLASLVISLSLQISRGYGTADVPCFFIFGDSLSDAGNNNNLVSGARADFLPYGVDFPGGPTGRFCNGRTAVDLVGDLLGLDGYIPSYLKARWGNPSKGVNYASGSAGILPETGFQVGMRISMEKQLKRHQEMINKISTTNVTKCLYSVYVGSNDWMLNYFTGPAMLTSRPQQYGDKLITGLTKQIGDLYSMGARKMIVWGMSPLGCLPYLNVGGLCSMYINNVLKHYNTKVKTLVDTLNSKYPDGKFIYINTMDIVSADGLKNLGLKTSSIPCCGAIQFMCLPLSVPCQNRQQHAYWDNAHPTEAANKILANRAVNNGQPGDTYPMDISQLAKLQI